MKHVMRSAMRRGRTVVGPARQRGIALVAIVGVVAVAAVAVVVGSLDPRAAKSQRDELTARSQAELADGLLAWAAMGVPKNLHLLAEQTGGSIAGPGCIAPAASGLGEAALEALKGYGVQSLCPAPATLRSLAGRNWVAPAPRLATPACGAANASVRGVEGDCWNPAHPADWLRIDGGPAMAFLVVPRDWQPGEGVSLLGVQAGEMMGLLSMRARVQLWGALDSVLARLTDAQLQGILLDEPACNLGGLITGADACFSPSVLPAEREQLVGEARLGSVLPAAHRDWLLQDAIDFPAITVDTPRGEATLPPVARPPAHSAAGKVEFAAPPGRAASRAVQAAAPGLEKAAAARAAAAPRKE